MNMKKIYSKKQLLNKISELKSQKKKIVLCHGVFDLVHLGHINHFIAAKKFGDFLIVSITKDQYIKKSIKGTLFNEKQRLLHLSNFEIIDAVVLSDEASSTDIIKLVRPNFYVKGEDYKNNKSDDTRKIFLEKELVEKFGGKIKYTNEKAFSSSNIINQKNLLYSEEQQKFLNLVKNKFRFNKFENELNSKKKINVTVIGELIFDIYNFGDVVGKSGKEPHLVMSNKNSETIIGGSAAIARNLSSFVNQVNLISPFGFEKKYKNLIDKQMQKNINTIFFKPNKNFKSISKTRFIDISSNYKLFGSYVIPEITDFKFNKEFISKIKKIISKSDLLIISDYGHGFLNGELLNIINSSNIFKSLNAQINSSSKGFTNITKYSKINSLIINETELRQHLKDQTNNINFLAKKIMKERRFDTLIVTSGQKGAKLFDKKKLSVITCPAFSDYSVDKIGAGDSILSISSFAIFSKFNYDLALLMGSLAAASTVKSIGNKAIVDKSSILRTLKYMLK